jgi:DNA-binding NarL/FixJ family response regulator
VSRKQVTKASGGSFDPGKEASGSNVNGGITGNAISTGKSGGAHLDSDPNSSMNRNGKKINSNASGNGSNASGNTSNASNPQSAAKEKSKGSGSKEIGGGKEKSVSKEKSGSKEISGSKENSGKPYRVLVVDNHFVARHGLKVALDEMPEVEVCGEAASGTDAIKLAKSTQPDLVILDLSLPELNGFEVARIIRDTLPHTDVLVLTHHSSVEVAKAALRAGALGYLTKADGEKEIVKAVQKIRHKRAYVTKPFAAKLQAEIQRLKALRSVPQSQLPDRGLDSEELAAVLSQSEKRIRHEAMALLRQPRSRTSRSQTSRSRSTASSQAP